MKNTARFAAGVLCALTAGVPALAQNASVHNPTWWAKYQTLLTNGPSPAGAGAAALQVGSNVDASNECGPQSETFTATVR
jgi:hypothetical protein